MSRKNRRPSSPRRVAVALCLLRRVRCGARLAFCVRVGFTCLRVLDSFTGVLAIDRGWTRVGGIFRRFQAFVPSIFGLVLSRQLSLPVAIHASPPPVKRRDNFFMVPVFGVVGRCVTFNRSLGNSTFRIVHGDLEVVVGYLFLLHLKRLGSRFEMDGWCVKSQCNVSYRCLAWIDVQPSLFNSFCSPSYVPATKAAVELLSQKRRAFWSLDISLADAVLSGGAGIFVLHRSLPSVRSSCVISPLFSCLARQRLRQPRQALCSRNPPCYVVRGWADEKRLPSANRIGTRATQE